VLGPLSGCGERKIPGAENGLIGWVRRVHGLGATAASAVIAVVATTTFVVVVVVVLVVFLVVPSIPDYVAIGVAKLVPNTIVFDKRYIVRQI
jgi:hypothetical protein